MLQWKTFPGENHADGRITQEQGENVVRFQPDPHGGIEQLWFHLRLTNPGVPLPERTAIHLENWNNALGARTHCQPVCRTGKGDWVRMPAGKVWQRDDDSCSLAWDIATPQPGADFDLAFCYPYGQEELDALLADTAGYWRCRTIGVSGKGRPFLRLSNPHGSPDSPRNGYYLMARQHAAETSGAWVLDGLLRRLAQRNAEIPVWCVPFADPDGVQSGDYGKNAFPQDMNRSWGPTGQMRQETRLMAQDLRVWRSRIKPEDSLVMDFHSPGAEDTGIYAYPTYDENLSAAARQRIRQLPQCLAAQNDPQRTADFYQEMNYKSGSQWGAGWCLGEYARNALQTSELSFEVSYWQAAGRILEIADYRAIGFTIADWMIV